MAMMEEVQATSKQMLEFPLQELEWSTASDIETSTKNNAFIAIVVKYQYSSLDVEATMDDLLCCGSLLQVALIAADKQACSQPILACLSKYQTLCNHSCVASQSFVTSCVGALKMHKMMMRALGKGKVDFAMKQFGKLQDLALAMAKISGDLETEAQLLVDNAEAGMLEACANQKDREAEKQAVIKEIAKTKQARDRQAKEVAELAADMDAEQREAAEAQKRADKLEGEKHGLKATFCNIVGGVADVITGPGKAISRAMGVLPPPAAPPGRDPAEYEREQAQKAKDRARQLADQKRAVNADLAASVSQLGSQQVKEHTLSETVKILGVCLKTMGKIVTTFKDVKTFWMSVAKHCQHLTTLAEEAKEMIEINDGEVDQDVLAAVYQSANNWAALGSVCLRAHHTMISSKTQTDNIMKDLPAGDACQQQLQDMLSKLESSLATQSRALEIQDAN